MPGNSHSCQLTLARLSAEIAPIVLRFLSRHLVLAYSDPFHGDMFEEKFPIFSNTSVCTLYHILSLIKLLRKKKKMSSREDSSETGNEEKDREPDRPLLPPMRKTDRKMRVSAMLTWIESNGGFAWSARQCFYRPVSSDVYQEEVRRLVFET